MRPLDERGKWQYKTEKEYLCMKNSEERGFTAAEFRTAQTDGWEKQYPYTVGKKKVYMTPSAAETQGLVRADKHPKSTHYGRQNPISERWNREEQLAAAQALECRGIISDRCELNRQIKADNALLQELKAETERMRRIDRRGR